MVNEYCPAVTAAAVGLAAPSVNVPASMSKKYLVEKLRLLVGLILCVSPAFVDVTADDGIVNVSTGVVQASTPVHNLIVLAETAETASENRI